MKEKPLIKFPDPFSQAAHAAFTARVMESMPVRRASRWPLWALAASVVLTIGLIGVIDSRTPQNDVALPDLRIANPLDLRTDISARVSLAADISFPAPGKGDPAVDVPFRIIKTDHQIRLAWEQEQGYRYIVQRCVLSAKGRACRTETVVNGGSFQDKAIEESPLVLYTVEAVKS